MERKVDEIITYNNGGETIYLEITPTKDSTCQGCFFYGNCRTYSPFIRNIIGTCDRICRTDNTSVIFKQINK